MNIENQININSNERFKELQLEIENSKFIESLIEKHKNELNINNFTFEEINKLDLNDINDLYLDNEIKHKVKLLKMATMFSDDKYLTNTLFNTLLNKNLNDANSYLIDMYNDKNMYLKSLNTHSSLSDMLSNYISNRIYNNLSNSTNQISDEYLNNILVNVNSYNFLTSLLNTSKSQYDKSKDNDDKYSFLYNDYYIKYQELLYKYEKQKNEENAILNQFTT